MSNLNKIKEEGKRKYLQEMLLMNGCPQCGLETNTKFVESVIDEISDKAYSLAIDEVVRGIIIREEGILNENINSASGIQDYAYQIAKQDTIYYLKHKLLSLSNNTP